MKLFDLSSRAVPITGTTGMVIESNAGTLLNATAADGNVKIFRSVNDGASWTLKQTMAIPGGASNGVRGFFVDSRGYIYIGGTTITTYETYTKFAELWQSQDDGLTWAKVVTAETSALWHICEDSTHRVYVNEYTETPASGTEFPALNIWRSNTSGNSFVKWHTATGETSPGARDGVRHIHTVHVDASDRVYAAYGDIPWTGYASHLVRLNAAGAIDIDYGALAGNGMTAILDATDGRILVGTDSDTTQNGIIVASPTEALSCLQQNLWRELGFRFEGYVFDLLRGHDSSVIYGNVWTAGVVQVPTMIYSLDEGTNWGALYHSSTRANAMHLNRGAANKRIYFSGSPCWWLPQPTADELGGRALA